MRIPFIDLIIGNGGGLLVQILRKIGIEYVFSIPGSQVLPIIHSISERDGIRIIVPRSETNGVFMAEGYARACGFPAVVLSTLGPGVANELKGLYSAKLRSVPLLSITPSQPPYKYARMGEIFQGLDQPAFLKGVCKANYVINEQDKIMEIVERAFYKCIEPPPGPVHIDISFPILFKPCIFYELEKKYVVKPDSPEIIIVTEEENSDNLLKTSILYGSGDNTMVISPGISGNAIPFSLGAKLAFMDTGVLVITSLKNLYNHLDSLEVARASGIEAVISSFRDSEEIKRIVNAFGIKNAGTGLPPALKIKYNRWWSIYIIEE